ncbi:alpha/beta fold hydrolase [Streptomyces syringium]|uniref:alpha/beta fold hydrolase n=1 Tax=Streptomyces syringium TaxID=76729 RepID=UPI0037CDC134
MPHAKSADGIRIAYRARGDGTPVVLPAGQANSHHRWDGVRADFHVAHRTITFDAPKASRGT